VSGEPGLVTRLALLVYFFAAGTFLIAVPWTDIWLLAVRGLPVLATILSHPTTRGAVSGFGLVLIVCALAEIRDAISRDGK
jgi:apolipoprotein N-acyltransferase